MRDYTPDIPIQTLPCDLCGRPDVRELLREDAKGVRVCRACDERMTLRPGRCQECGTSLPPAYAALMRRAAGGLWCLRCFDLERERRFGAVYDLAPRLEGAG